MPAGQASGNGSPPGCKSTQATTIEPTAPTSAEPLLLMHHRHSPLCLPASSICPGSARANGGSPPGSGGAPTPAVGPAGAAAAASASPFSASSCCLACSCEVNGDGGQACPSATAGRPLRLATRRLARRACKLFGCRSATLRKLVMRAACSSTSSSALCHSPPRTPLCALCSASTASTRATQRRG